MTIKTMVSVSATVSTPAAVTPNKHIIQRKISSKTIADDMVSRITGKLVGFDDLYDPKTGEFKTEDELRACGAVFVTIHYSKVLDGPSDIVKKGRNNGLQTPFIRKTSAYQVIANINWQSYINKRGTGDFVADETRANGVENYAECRAIGKTTKGFMTVNGVAFRVIDDTRYFDKDGNEYTDHKTLKEEYLKVASQKSKEDQARKHGIDVKFDPQYRTTRIDSCSSIRAFGFEYLPTDNK